MTDKNSGETMAVPTKGELVMILLVTLAFTCFAPEILLRLLVGGLAVNAAAVLAFYRPPKVNAGEEQN
jgi:hypothetical protein